MIAYRSFRKAREKNPRGRLTYETSVAAVYIPRLL
jgi:hypothetical protein